MANCTIKEALSTTNYSMTSCHMPVRDKGWETLWLGLSFFIVSLVFFVLRMIARCVGEAGFYWDDYMMVAAIITSAAFAGMSIPLYLNGLGKDIWTLPFGHITDMLYVRLPCQPILDTPSFAVSFQAVDKATQAYYHGEWIYGFAIFFTKMSLLLFYLRVFPVRSFRIQVYVIMAVLVMFTVTGTIVSTNQCTPVQGAWEYWDGEQQFHCQNRNAVGWSSAVVNMSLDIAIIIVPLRPLSKLAMSWRKKIQLIIMFTVGIL